MLEQEKMLFKGTFSPEKFVKITYVDILWPQINTILSTECHIIQLYKNQLSLIGQSLKLFCRFL
jgi:hypothetical protein